MNFKPLIGGRDSDFVERLIQRVLVGAENDMERKPEITNHQSRVACKPPGERLAPAINSIHIIGLVE